MIPDKECVNACITRFSTVEAAVRTREVTSLNIQLYGHSNVDFFCASLSFL